MQPPVPKMMRAVALERFGGPDLLAVKMLPVPELGPDEVLIRVETAGVGEWDPFERQGGYAEMQGVEASFPYILGSEGAGRVAALGERVSHFKLGDAVYAPAFLNPKGGFYAEYAAVNADLVSWIPHGLTIEQAGVMSGVAITALRGLEDVLGLQPGEALMIFGASGGVGHMAVQIAKRMRARVLAVASGASGVALAKRLGSDAAIDGHTDDVLAAARAFAPQGLDVALMCAGGAVAEQALQAMRSGGRMAYPNGVYPEPQARADIQSSAYNGEADPDIIRRLNTLIASGPFGVHIARTFPLEQAAQAHRALEQSYLGKLALRVQEQD